MGFLSFSLVLGLATATSIVSCLFHYSETLKKSDYYFLILTGLSLISTLIWAYVAKNTSDSNRLFFYGWVWDFLITLVFTFVPVLFFDVSIGIKKGVGLFLIFVGTFLLS